MIGSEKGIRCPKCGSEELVKASEHPYALFVGGHRVQRGNGTLGEWWVCTSLSCEDGQKNDHSIRVSYISQDEE